MKQRETLDAVYQKHVRLQRAENAEAAREHSEYLKTDAWRRKREKVMKRAGGLCEGCMDRPATEVHHLTYAHWKDELLFELVALCGECHGRCHADKVLSAKTAAGGVDDADALPCYNCRMLGWVSSEGLECMKFGLPALVALGDTAVCNNGQQLDPLR